MTQSQTNPEAARNLHPPKPLGENILREWMLNPDVAYMNHGCFGARPRTVSETQQQWRDRIERDPIELLDRRRNELLDEAKQPLAEFLGVQSRDFGFITNATGGVNVVLRSLRFEPDDEILTVNHVYNAVRMSMKFIADSTGAKAIEVPLPLPVSSPDELIAAVETAITDRTKLIIVDHVTSPTAVVFPVKEIVERCERRGIDVLIDGAHAPGMLPLDIESLGAAYYTGNLHKWPSAPMGSAFLWVRKDKQRAIHPLTISHFYGLGLANEFSWQGTRDISGWLSVPAALAYFDRYGWENVQQHNHAMATWVQAMLCEKWHVEPSTPRDGSMIGSMTTVRLPEGVRRYESVDVLQQKLMKVHKIEVPIFDWDGTWWIRPSCQIYTPAEAYKRLADAVLELSN